MTSVDGSRVIDLDVSGMTCSSCANRIERKLNRMPGVQAEVNYATESARVAIPPDVTVDDVLATVAATGYRAALPQPQADVSTEVAAAVHDETDSLRQRFWVSLALAVPVAALAMIPALQFTFWQWLSFALASPVVVWGAWPFHVATAVNLRHRAVTMDTLISVGTIAAYLWSTWALFLGGAGEPGYRMSHALISSHGGMGTPDLYLEVAAAVPVFILAGRWFEARSKRRAGAALRALLDVGARDAVVLVDGIERQLPVSQLSVGQLFVVRPGERIATDGIVREGSGAVDESLLTGESLPIDVEPGSRVTGATINVDGRLVVEATRVGDDTRLARIARLVRDAQTGKAPVQRLADRISSVFVPIVIGLSIVTLVAWLLRTGDAQAAFTAAVAVLIIACPCALGLATPIALLVGTGRGAQIGVLIRGPEVLEDTRRVDTIVLDKTGTVTMGHMTVHGTFAVDGDDRALLRRAASVESGSEHPVGRAIMRAAAGLPLGSLTDFVNERGAGVVGTIEGERVRVGRRSWSSDAHGALDDWALSWEDQGATIAAVWVEDRIVGAIAISDEVRPTSSRAIVSLRELGLEPVLLTGDNESAARSVADRVGITKVLAQVQPEDKLSTVAAMQGQGARVAMVGDGVNDAAALVQADLGIAMGGGSDAAVEASDLTLVRPDLLAAVDAIRLSRRTLATIKGNLFWAFAYNVAMIPLAAFGFLSPLLAGAAMALSSAFVVGNSLRLRRFRPTE